MGIAERREIEKEVIRRKIIDSAKVILTEQGYEKLSVRKIADKIEYSPGIIYHYFKDKGEIVNVIVEDGYKRILQALNEIPPDIENPEKTLEKGLRIYIDLMMESPEEFKAILMNNIDKVKDKVNILDRRISKERKSIKKMCTLLSSGMEKGKFRKMDVELTAQIIWTTVHGLISRLVLEGNIPTEQRDKLIDHYLEIIFKGIEN